LVYPLGSCSCRQSHKEKQGARRTPLLLLLLLLLLLVVVVVRQKIQQACGTKLRLSSKSSSSRGARKELSNR
jgi:hypothetical protein